MAAYEVTHGMVFISSSSRKIKENVGAIKGLIKDKLFIKDFGDLTPRYGDTNTSEIFYFGNDAPEKRFLFYGSTPQSFTRGLIHRHIKKKIEFLWGDDMETEATYLKPTERETTYKKYIGDVVSSLSQDKRVVMHFANYLYKTGNTQRIMDATTDGYLSVIPLYKEIGGEKVLSWDARYTGLRVTSANKELIANSFRSAIQDGTIILHSNDMYNSIMNYTHEIHMERRGFTKDNLISTGGRHFDLLNSARYAYFGLETRMLKREKKVPKFNTQLSTTNYLEEYY